MLTEKKLIYGYIVKIVAKPAVLKINFQPFFGLTLGQHKSDYNITMKTLRSGF